MIHYSTYCLTRMTQVMCIKFEFRTVGVNPKRARLVVGGVPVLGVIDTAADVT